VSHAVKIVVQTPPARWAAATLHDDLHGRPRRCYIPANSGYSTRVAATPDPANLVAVPATPVSEKLPTIDDLDDLVELVQRMPNVFVRYSAGPVADAACVSRDYESGVDMPGLSVTTVIPEPWWPRPTTDWVARRVCKYADLAAADDERKPWLLVGEVAGYGPDHEPLVTNVEPLAWIGPRALQQALDIYRRRFDVGRGSA
jgi:hypothetical protein